jgi:succinate-semialdehyde dehydrogenase/glutarate-semialdehyde dehydrogenase
MTFGESMMTIQAINPTTSEVLNTYEEMGHATVNDIVSKTQEAFLGWRRTSFSDRAGLMRKAAEILRADTGEYARLMAQEMGKPVRDGIAEAQKCALGCDFYAEHAESFLARESVSIEARKSFVTFNPRSHTRRNAVELSVLAGLSFRCAQPDGG